MTLGATDKGICFLGFGASGELLAALRREYPEAELDSAARPAFGGWVQAIAEHLQGGAPDLDLPLDVRATAFQTQVWDYLRAIPYGEVRSYAEVAAALGRPRAARGRGAGVRVQPCGGGHSVPSRFARHGGVGRL